MELDEIIDKLKNKKPGPVGVEKEFSVLIPLIYVEGELHILYELRSENIRRQPREISFPGGAVEEGESFKEAAIRETMEELNLTRDKIEFISPMDYLVSSAGLRINCYLGYLTNVDIKKIKPNIGEVDHVFTVPLKFLLENEPDRYLVSFKRNMAADFPYNLIPNGKDYEWYESKDEIYFYSYKNYNIWGFTAKMTKNFIDIIKK